MEERRPDAALPQLWSLVELSHLVQDELHGYLRLMARAFEMVGRTRAAGTIALFVGEAEAASRLAKGVPLDEARVNAARRRPREAAMSFQQAGWLGHAAIHLEVAGDDRGARVLWEQLAQQPSLQADPYTAGLVRFNLGRACGRLGDKGASRRALVESVHLLEAAADLFETRGQRERAFDCFQVLLTLGKHGAFENLAEGYLNCIRILKEDNLKYYVLQYYEDFQELALQQGELHAAATLFREAAEFARRHALPYDRHYLRRAADAHVTAAERALSDAAPVEMTENAYAASIDAFNDLGAYSKVREIYGRLAALPLTEKRRERYARLQQRLAGMADEGVQSSPLPEYLRMETAYPEIWRLDVVEWEQQGDAAETMAEVLQDSKWPDYTRRRALLCRIHQLGAQESPLAPGTLATLAAHLGRVEIYAALAPLERIYAHDDAGVRAAAMRAVRQLFFKRSYVLIMQGLRDPDGNVRKAALDAVRELHFPHAFDPLARIYREAADANVRRAALASVGKIPTVDAAEMLIDVLRHGDKAERDIARDVLIKADMPDLGGLLRRAAAAETGSPKKEIEQVLRTRGG